MAGFVEKAADDFRTAAVTHAAEFLIGSVCACVGGYVGREFWRYSDVVKDLDQLHNTSDRIHALLADAEQRRVVEDDHVLDWLRKLKSLVLDADDLLDEFRTRKAISDHAAASRKRKRDWFRMPKTPLWYHKRAISTKVREIRGRYETIVQERQEIRLEEHEARRVPAAPSGAAANRAGSFQDNSRFHGRSLEINRIVTMFQSGADATDLPVVAISGAAGIGKTDLARAVTSDSRPRNRFNHIIWVSLSPGFDAPKTTKEIIQAFTEKKCDLPSMNLLQGHLHRLLVRGDETFLLVLDNVWNDRVEFWDNLRAPLLGGKKGSMVLITSRSEIVLNSMQVAPDRRVSLGGLPEDDALTLLQDRAFGIDQAGRVIGQHPHLESIGRQIVRKCQGSPIAIKVMGSLLYSKGAVEDEWRDVLREMPATDDILPALKVSYDHLPLHLKWCFAFCSMFPVNHEFFKDELVKLWLAAGFLPPGGRRRAEYVVGSYFDDLSKRCFFQSSNGQQEKYTMPSLIQELAHSIAKYEYFRVDGDVDPYADLRTIRYALFCQGNGQLMNFEKICEYGSLRALIVRNESEMPAPSKQVVEHLFQRLRYMRVLDLSNSKLRKLPGSVANLILLRYLSLYGSEVRALPTSVGNLYNLQTLELGECRQLQRLPDSIGNLTRLRYLGLYRTRIKSLPESVSSLCNLHTLEVGECYRLVKLPQGMSNLVNLRHLGLHLDWETWDRKADLICMPPRIGQLTCLKTLSRFAVFPQEGCTIGELKNLNLRGELCISKLENVGSLVDAEGADLTNKRDINSLMLQWSHSAFSNLQNRGQSVEDAIKGLQPHKNLKYLWIENYVGQRFPQWLEDPSFVKLETLRLCQCRQCDVLPMLGRLPQLKNLYIEGMPEVKQLGRMLSNSNQIRGSASLEMLSLSDMPNMVSLFEVEQDDVPKLSQIVISGCPKLRDLCTFPQALAKLEIRDCPGLVNMKRSYLERCTSLKTLKIERCQKLVLVAPKGFHDITSLEYLEMSSCPRLLVFANHGLPSALKELQLQDIPQLKSLPDLPAGVQTLDIRGCPPLQIYFCRHGVNWPKVQHIPKLHIEESLS